MSDRKQVYYFQGKSTGILLLHAGVDIEPVVDLNIVGRRGDCDPAQRVAQLNKRRPNDRWEEVEHLHAVIVLPVGALTFNAVGECMAFVPVQERRYQHSQT